MSSVSHSLGITVGRARAGCKIPGPIQTFWGRGVQENWTKSQVSGKAAVDVDVEGDGVVSLNFTLLPGKGESGYRAKSTGGITCWGPTTDPGQKIIEAIENEDPEGATISGVPDKEGVLQGQEEVATTDGTIVTRWYFKRGPPSCEPDSVMLEMARERVDATARDAQESFLQLAVLVTQLSFDPIGAEVGTFLRSQQGKMVSAYAASAAYGQAVATVMIPHPANTERLAASGIPAVDAPPPDARFAQLSGLMLRFGVQAQVLQHWLEQVERYRERYVACLGN